MSEKNKESEDLARIGSGVPIPGSGIGTRISEIASRVGSKKALARKAHISESHLYRYISGKSEPTASKLVALADAGKVSISWLATGEGNKDAEARPGAQQGGTLDLDMVEYVIAGLESRWAARGVRLPPQTKGHVIRLVLEYLQKEGKTETDDKASLDNIIELAAYR